MTAVIAFIVTEHDAVAPAQLPPHPANENVLSGVAVNVTDVPASKFALQICGQLIPAGALTTLPDPVSVSDNWNCCGGGGVEAMNAAVTWLFALTLTVHVVVVPVHPPLHPVKEDPAAGVSVSVTCTPASKFPVQFCGQLIPVGALVMMPEPLLLTVNWNCWAEGVGDGGDGGFCAAFGAFPHPAKMKITEPSKAPARSLVWSDI